MTTPLFDAVVHPEQRLRICAFLLTNDDVAFAVLRESLAVSESALSRQLKPLVEAGYVALSKERGVPRPRTWVTLTEDGRRACLGHLAALQAMVDGAARPG